MHVVALALVLVATNASEARAQEEIAHAPGLQPNRDYFSQLHFEFIDTLTGGLVLQFTDLVLPGNAGRDLRFVRTFTAQGEAWDWRFGIAGMVMAVCTACGNPLLAVADGARYGTLGDVAGYPWFTTDDRQFLRYNVATSQLHAPDGSISTYAWSSNGWNYLTSHQDAFGNQITLAGWGSNTLTVTQQLGNGESRAVTLQSGMGVPWGGSSPWVGWPSSMTYAGRTWTYASQWQSYYLRTTSATSPSPENVVWQYSEYWIDGTLWWGVSVTTPNGGTIQYTFEERQFLDYCDEWDCYYWSTWVVISRATSGPSITPGTWSYQYNLIEGVSTNTGVTSSTGIKTTYVFDAFQKLSSTTLEQPVGTVLQADSRTYQIVPIRSSQTPGVRELSTHAITRYGRTYTTQYTYSASNYGDYHRPSQIAETGDALRTLVARERGCATYLRRPPAPRAALSQLGLAKIGSKYG